MMNIFRRIVAVVVLGIAATTLMLSGFLRTIDSLAGSSQQISDTAVSILSTTAGSKVVADSLVTQLTKDADPNVKPVMTAKKTELVEAVAAAIRDPETLRMASDDFQRYYNAVKTNTAITINPQPIIWRLTAAMHRVDARIPSSPHDVGNVISYDVQDKAMSLPNESANGASWVMLFVGLGIALLASVFLVRHPLRKLIAVGLTLAAPGAILISTGPQVQSFIKGTMSEQDDSARRLVDLVMGRVNSALTGTGITLLLAAIVVVGGWMALRRVRDGQQSPSVGLPTHEQTPEPPVAAATDNSGVQ